MRRRLRFVLVLMCHAALLRPARAEYYAYNVPKGSDIITQEVRWPFWAESTYNAIWCNDLIGDGPARAYFYGGVPEANPARPDEQPANIIWSFWPVSHPDGADHAVHVAWAHPQMYAPLVVGEGASGKASGAWPQIKTGQWYRFVMRIWQPTVNPDGHAFVGQWMRDPADGRWVHLATMEAPFRATGLNGLSGFIEDFSHGNRNPRRTEFRHAYGRAPGGDWTAASEFSPSVRQHREKGTTGLIDDGTAAFFETCSGPDYAGNLDYDAGRKKRTLTLRQPPQPDFPAPAVRSVAARRSGLQVLVTWDVDPTASPPFAWRIDALATDGRVVATTSDRDPEARQAIVPAAAGTATVRLTLTDLFDHDVASPPIAPTSADPRPAATVTAVEHGLDFVYAQAPSSDAAWDHLPDLAKMQSQLSGTVDGLDLTVRRRRTRYAVGYHGYLNAPTDGIYGFRLAAYDGARLTIDGAAVVDNDGVHSYTDKVGHAELARGPHAVQVDYFCDVAVGEGSAYADRMALSWEGPGMPMQPVPPMAFTRAINSRGVAAQLILRPTTTPIANTAVPLAVAIDRGAGSVSRVAYYVDDVLWATADAAPWSTRTMLAAGAFDVRARLFTRDGRSYDTPTVYVTTKQASTGPWQVTQLGTPPPRRPLGAATMGSDGVALVGDGAGIAWQPVTGDATITAHVAARPDRRRGTQDDGTTPGDDWVGGVMFRPDLESPDTFLGNSFCAAYARVDRTTHLQCQLDHNGGGPVAGPDLGRLDWVRLHRAGNTFTASLSADGVTWTDVGTRAVPMPAKLYAAVFIFSRAGYNPAVNGWRFDHVAITH